MSKVVIIMGSKSDSKWAEKITGALDAFSIESVVRIASAHKVPLKCYDLIKKYEKEDVVFITIAGRSNALSGFADAQTYCPVIACPPYSDSFAGGDIYSSLRMPSGVSPLVVMDPKNAALAAAKIIGLKDKAIQAKVSEFQKKNQEILEVDDAELQK